MNIWAHRGCSQNYPENTLLAFQKAAEIPGLTGIELDIQLTKDNHMVVCHDERVDRTTDGIGQVGGYTLAELKKLRISGINGTWEKIPTIQEVVDKQLGVMDLAASILCMENHMPMAVFGLNEENSIANALKGKINGTTVTV